MNSKKTTTWWVKIPIFVFLTFTSCSLISYAVYCYIGELEFVSGLKDGMYLVSPTPKAALFLSMLAAVLMELAAAWLSAIRPTLWRFFGLVILAVCVGVVAVAFPVYPGQHRHFSRYFLDGFKERMRLYGVHDEMVSWARGVFADTQINTRRESEVSLPTNSFPAFLKPVFDIRNTDFNITPQAIVRFDSNKEPYEIDVTVTYGVDWGIEIMKDPAAYPDSPLEPKPENCGDGVFAYVYFYK